MNKLDFSKVQYLTISADFSGQRIDNFLLARLKGVPKTRIYRMLRKGETRVNKKRIDPSYRLQANDIVRLPPIRLGEPTQVAKPGQSLMALLAGRILYQDSQLLILNKPSGIPVHGGSAVKVGIVEALRCMYPELTQLELAHRLDADTSGCLVFAKKRSILRQLHELFRIGEVNKIYWALTKGHWQDNELIVDAPLHKNQLSSGERIVKVNKEGKSALTTFKVLKTFQSSSLMEVNLHTGRTHQIRVHAQYQKHPIAGDEKYGDREFNRVMRQKGLKRLFLHAYTVGFTLSTGENVKVTAPLEPELEAFLRELS